MELVRIMWMSGVIPPGFGSLECFFFFLDGSLELESGKRPEARGPPDLIDEDRRAFFRVVFLSGPKQQTPFRSGQHH